MASLSPPFILCPLSDRKSLLGIRPDQLPNKAIITFGRNIAIRYHISEQKQECSWTTSKYWFTSPVTYCYDYGKYGAVLNNNIIALWDENDSTLSEINKMKLPVDVVGIHSSSKSRTTLVMKNGHVAYLSDISEDKTKVACSRLDLKETITNYEVDEKNSLCYMATTNPDNPKLLKVSSMTINGKEAAETCTIGSDQHEMMGSCLSAVDSESFIAYYGNDGYIYKKKISPSMKESECSKLTKLSKYISHKSPVVMCPLPDNSCIAMYGCDPSEEGAIVVVYDTNYDVVVSKQSLKLYSSPPLLERIGNALFVPLGLHILVLNFRLTKSLLSSVVGKHQAKLDEEVFEGRNPWSSKGWDTSSNTNSEVDNLFKTQEKTSLENLKKSYPDIWETIQQVQIFESEGQPEAVICNHVIPSAIENRNTAALDWILDTFLDIPETHIVSMVIFSLKQTNGHVDVPNERLNKLLLRKFDKSLLTLNLRHVAYDDVKMLINYVNNLVENQWKLNADFEDEYPVNAWLNWCSALVDAHYTKFVLHNDSEIIQNVLDTVTECTRIMKDVEEMEPYLLMTYSKTDFEPVTDLSKRWRTETIVFE